MLPFLRGDNMNIFQKIMKALADAAKVIVMVATAGLVVMIVAELINRNIMGNSFRASIEVCGIMFLWMAFIGLIPLYQDHGLMRLDFLVARIKNPTVNSLLTIFTYAVGAFLGVVMVMAFRAYYPYICNRYYSTFKVVVPYTVQYIPMAIAGAYIAVNAVGNAIITLVVMITGKNRESEEA